MLIVLISTTLSESSADADPQDTLASIPTFQQQFAANLAKSGGNVPGRFSYFVNSVHPVYPTRDKPEDDSVAELSSLEPGPLVIIIVGPGKIGPIP